MRWVHSRRAVVVAVPAAVDMLGASQAGAVNSVRGSLTDPAEIAIADSLEPVRASVVARSVVKVPRVLAIGAANQPATAARHDLYREFADGNLRYCRWATVMKVTARYICRRLEDDAVGPLTQSGRRCSAGSCRHARCIPSRGR